MCAVDMIVLKEMFFFIRSDVLDTIHEIHGIF